MQRPTRALSTVIAALILVVITIGAAITVYALATGLIFSTSSQATLEYQNSYIKIAPGTGNGVVYLNIHNAGPGSAQILTITLKTTNGSIYGVWFDYNDGTPTVHDMCSSNTSCSTASTLLSSSLGNATMSGTSGVAIVPAVPGTNDGKLILPAGSTVSITVNFVPDPTCPPNIGIACGGDIRNNFSPDITYSGTVKMASGHESNTDFINMVDYGQFGPTLTGLDIPIQVPATSY